MDWPMLGRFVNIGISLVCGGLLLRKSYLYWPGYQSRTKDFWWVLFCWTMVIFLGTTEVLLDWDTQFRVLFTTFALLLTVKVLLRTNEIEKPTFTDEL